MKRKLFLLIALVLVMSFSLAGCSMFTINEERDYKQVIATVEVDGVTSGITKGEMNEYFSQNYQMFAYYNDYTAVEALDASMVNLAKREVLLLLAKKSFGDINKNSYDFLTDNEKAYVYESTNKMLEENWDTILKGKIKDKYDKNTDEEDEEEDKDLIAPRPVVGEKEEDDTYKTYKTYEKKDDFFTLKNDATGLEKEAIDELKEDLEAQYKDFNYYLRKQSDSRLIAKYQEKNQGTPNISEESLEDKYNLTVTLNKDAYVKGSTYKTDIEKDNGDILVHNGTYVKVKSILLGFSDLQDSAFKDISEKFSGTESKDYVNSIRKALVEGSGSSNGALLNTVTSSLGLKTGSLDKGLTVNVSNYNYKAGEYCRDENCSCHNDKEYHKELDAKIKAGEEVWATGNGTIKDYSKPICECVECKHNAYVAYNVTYTKILSDIADDLAKAETDAKAEYKNKYTSVNIASGAGKAGEQMFVGGKVVEAFEKWIYMVNDDDGMFGGKEYVETPAGQDSSYVPEYTALVRSLVNEENATKGLAKTVASSYVLKDKTITINSASGTVDNNNKISYIINDFGIHIVMISTLPIDKVVNAGLYDSEANPDFKIGDYNVDESSDVAKEIIKANKIFTLQMGAFVSFDEETGKAITVKEKYKKAYEEKNKTDVYSQYENSMFKILGKNEDFFTKVNAKGVVVVADGVESTVKVSKKTSVYNQLLEICKKIDKQNTNKN